MPAESKIGNRMPRRVMCINSILVIILAAVFLIYPPVRAVLDLQDPALRRPGIPKAAWRLYRNLTPRYAAWARQRVAQGGAEKLSTSNISGTEWPLFGSVFFLWSLESLQKAWEAGDHIVGLEPKVFARDAIVAASELVIDPKHATWVRKHWGDDYLHHENVFYRMLIIASLTSREKLLHDGAHTNLLADQVESFAKELDASPSGLLEDYPSECYPGDVMAAIACIRRADAVLGTDHLVFVSRALRGFTGRNATRHQLPPYAADARTGQPLTESRGCGNSYFCLTSPELWPRQAAQWYDLYDRLFWQQRITAVGYREYPKDIPHTEWTMDVDAGPVIAGHGVSASAFGVGAARKNGRFDRAFPLATEMLATTWELPNGVLAVPRLLSNLSDAPMLGEAAILWLLTVQPEKGFPVKTGGTVPGYVYIVVVGVLLFGTLVLLEAIWRFRTARREAGLMFWAPRLQVVLWFCLLSGALTAELTGLWWLGTAFLLVALVIPIQKKRRPKDDLDEP